MVKTNIYRLYVQDGVKYASKSLTRSAQEADKSGEHCRSAPDILAAAHMHWIVGKWTNH